MWTEENTEGFTHQELRQLRYAQGWLEARHPNVDPANIADILNNQWLRGLTRDELIARADKKLRDQSLRRAAPQWILDLYERAEHSDTMRRLSPLELQWLKDWEAHFASSK